MTRLREREFIFLGNLLKKTVGELEQNTGPVPGIMFTAAGPAMGQVQQDLETLLNDLVGSLSFYIHDETRTAGVVLKLGVVETLCF
jgi:hypothetical protein